MTVGQLRVSTKSKVKSKTGGPQAAENPDATVTDKHKKVNGRMIKKKKNPSSDRKSLFPGDKQLMF